jgi:hypothetical protein
MKNVKEIYHGMWDYSGSWAPKNGIPGHHSCRTFSFGIFQWWEKASGNGFKKLPVEIRVRAFVHQHEAATKYTEKICQQLNSGEKTTSDFNKIERFSGAY